MAEKCSLMRLDSIIAPDFPPVRVMSAAQTGSISLHTHDFYELVYVREGFCLHEVCSQVSLLMEGDLFILKPGIPHRYVGNRVTRIYNCVFSADALCGQKEALSQLPGLNRLFSEEPMPHVPVLHLSLSERKACHRQTTAMAEECEERKSGFHLRLPSMLLCLLIDYSRAYAAHTAADSAAAAWSGYAAQAMNYIDAHYAESSLSVHQIAGETGVSADYLSRQFRQALGIPAQEYLKRYRFARAMELLQGGKSVSEVASAVGFASLCHFSREFKKEMGVTPSQYRSQNEL